MWYNLDKALFEAAARWDIYSVIELVNEWADINFSDEESSVLEQACLSRSFDVVKYLVEKNVDATDKWTWISLIAAAHLGDLDFTMFSYLIDNGAIIDPKYTVYKPDNNLVTAASRHQWYLVKTYLEKGEDINGKVYNSFLNKQHNSLYFAIRENNLEMIKYLLEHWIDQEGALNSIIKYIFTYTGDIEAIKYYLEKWYSFNIEAVRDFVTNSSFDKNNKEHIDILRTLLKRKSCYKELEDIIHDQKLYSLLKD